MSDLPPSSPLPPPPPPSSMPSPSYAPPPSNPPPAPFPPSGAPGQVPAPYMPVAAAGAGIAAMSQFSGSALWSIALGVVSIVVPFVLGYVFFFLPFIGIYYGIRAIRRGQLAGGIVGIFLCCIGGFITILSRVVK